MARQAPHPPDEKIVIETYLHLIYEKKHSVYDFDNAYMKQVSAASMQLFW